MTSKYDAAIDSVVFEGPPEPAPDSTDPSKYDAAIDHVVELDEQQKDNELGNLFEIAQKTPDERAAVLEIARTQRVDPEVVQANLPAFKTAAELSKSNPRQFRQDNPELYRLVTENPHAAPIVLRDEKMSTWTQAMVGVRNWEAKHWVLGTYLETLTAGQGPYFLGGVILAGLNMDPKAAAAFRSIGIPVPEPARGVEYQKKELGAIASAQDQFGRGLTRNTLSKAGFAALWADQRVSVLEQRVEQGINAPEELEELREAAYQANKRVLELDLELGQEVDYGENAAPSLVLDVIKGTTSTIPTMKAAGVSAGVGFGIGAAFGFYTKTGVVAGGATGAKILGAAGMFGASFELEAGSTYIEIRKMRDDRGKLIDADTARGAAVLYGLFAAGIELTTEFGALLKVGKRSLVTNAGYKPLLKRLALVPVVGMGGEGIEETIQQGGQIFAEHVGLSISARRMQPFDFAAARKELIEARRMGTLGAAGIGPAMTAIPMTQQAVQIEKSRRSAAQVAGIVDLGKSRSVQAAPKAVAKMVQEQSEAMGRPIEAIFLDPVRFTEIAQKNEFEPSQLALELMGEEGPTRIQEALEQRRNEPGGRATLEVSVGDFLEQWGPKPIAELLVQDMTGVSGGMTARELQEQAQEDEERFKEHAQRIVQETQERGEWVPQTEGEQALVDSVEAQLDATGQFSPQVVEATVMIERAKIETAVQRTGRPKEDLMQLAAVRVQKATPTQIAEQMVPAGPEPFAARVLSEQVLAMEPAERAQVLYQDPNTGILNQRGYEAVDHKTPMVAHFSVEGIKWKNTESHASGNLLYRAAARAMAAVAENSGKWGGDFVADVNTVTEGLEVAKQVEARLLEVLKQENPRIAANLQGLEVTVGVAPRGDNLSVSVQAAAHENIKEKEQREQRADEARSLRGKTPRGVPVQDPAELILPTTEPITEPLPPTLLERAGALTPEETFQQAYIDPMTGLLTREGFFALPKKAYVIAFDLDNLRLVNDEYGSEVGNQLLTTFAELAKLMGGSSMDMAHLSGDEFAAQTEDPELAQEFVDLLGWVADNADFELDLPGIGVTRGIRFGYGIGESYDAADKLVDPFKKRRKAEIARRDPETGARVGRDPESIARGDRSQARRRGNRAQRTEGLQGGTRPQVWARQREVARQTGPGARRARTLERTLDPVRREIARLGDDPTQLTGALRRAVEDEASPLAGALATAQTLLETARYRGDTRKAATTGKQAATKWGVFQSMLLEHLVDNVSEKEDGRYQRGERPGPFPSEVFDPINEALNLEGDQKVSGAFEGFDLLTRRHRNPRSREAISEALTVMRSVEGYERLDLPLVMREAEIDDLAAAEEQHARELAEEQAREEGRETAVDDEGQLVDAQTGEILFQPAWHGTAVRGIRQFELAKVGTGEGAQAFGWGLYFADRKEVADYYREQLGSVVDGILGMEPETEVEIDVQEQIRKGHDELGAVPDLKTARDWISRDTLDFTDIERMQAFDAMVERAGVVGQTYKVEVPADKDLLDYDKPWGEQPKKVREALEAAGLVEVRQVEEPDGTVLFEEITVPGGETTTSENFTGAWLYGQLGKMIGDRPAFAPFERGATARETSRTLLAAGIPGLRYLDQVSRGAERGTHNYVIWDEAAVAITETLYQAPPGGPPRGWIDITKRAMRDAAKVFVTEEADPSTPIHEFSHLYFEMLGDLSELEGASPQIRDDWVAALKYLGVESRDQVTVEHKELWAKSWEGYMLEGKAPSLTLVGVFTRFRIWLLRIYGNLKALGVELTPEIRGVFDRLLATDQEIDAVRRQMGFEPQMWASAEQAGMTEADYKRYVRNIERENDRARLKLQRELAQAAQVTASTEWRGEVKKNKVQATTEFDARPDYTAFRYLRSGELVDDQGVVLKDKAFGKLDRKAVREIMGKEAPPVERKLTGRIVKQGGEHPDTVAERFDYPTGRAMLEAVVAMPDRDGWIADRAEQLTRDAHPELLLEKEQLEQAALEALHAEGTIDSAIKEWETLLRLGQVPGLPPVKTLELAARTLAEQQKAKRIAPEQALRKERTAAEKSIAAAAQQDFDTAAKHKQDQVLNHLLYRELNQARKDREGFLVLSKKLSADKARGRLGKAGAAYRDVVDSLLEALGLAKPRPQEVPRLGLDAVLQSMEENGDTVVFDTDLVRAVLAAPRSWKELSVGEMREMSAALTNIKKSATERNTVLIDGRRHSKEKVIEELRQEAEAFLPKRKPLPSSKGAMTYVQKGFHYGGRLIAELLKIEEMVLFLGGPGISSMWFRAIMAPIQKAKAYQADLLKEVIKPIIDAFEAIPKNARSRLWEKVDGRSLFPNHIRNPDPPSRRFELLMLALNRGNESNIERLTEARGITLQEVDAAIGLLTAEELAWVQSVWDASEALWPLSREVEERDAGVVPGKIPLTPFMVRLQDGSMVSMKGGYFPAVYDPRVSRTGEVQAADKVAALLDPLYVRPGTRRTHLKKRAKKYSDVILLDASGVGASLAQVTHDIAYREAVKSVGGLLLNDDVKDIMRNHLGNERQSMFPTWIQDVGQMRAFDISSQAAFTSRLLRRAKSNMAVGILGYAKDIALADFPNLLAASAMLKTRHWAAGLYDFLRHPFETFKFAHSKSGELRTRRDEYQQAFGNQIAKLTRRFGRAGDFVAGYKLYAFFFMDWSEKLIGVPAWMGAYRQALAENPADEQHAIDFANSFVRRKIFPGHSAVDQVAVIRDRGLIGASTLFYGWMSTMFQHNASLMHQVYVSAGFRGTIPGKIIGGAKAMPAVIAHLMVYWILTSVLAEWIVGRGQEDDEEWDEWFLRKLVMAPISAFPWIPGFVESRLMGRQPSLRTSPGWSVFERMLGAIDRLLSDEDADADDALKVIESAGVALGIPSVRPMRELKYIFGEEGAAKDIAQGDIPGLVSGLWYGKRERQAANPLTPFTED